MSKITKYIIWSIEHNGWWRPRRRGYTEFRSAAGMYDFEDAKQICDSANITEGDIPNEAIVPIEVCEYCNGSGELSEMAQVYPGEPHMADIGSRKCICQLEE